MNYAATNVDLIQPDGRYNEIQAMAEKIGADADRLFDAVYEWDRFDRGIPQAVDLTEMRITVADGAWLMGEFYKGRTLSEILADESRTGQEEAFNELHRVVKEAAKYVDDKVLQAAKDEVQS